MDLNSLSVASGERIASARSLDELENSVFRFIFSLELEGSSFDNRLNPMLNSWGRQIEVCDVQDEDGSHLGGLKETAVMLGTHALLLDTPQRDGERSTPIGNTVEYIRSFQCGLIRGGLDEEKLQRVIGGVVTSEAKSMLQRVSPDSKRTADDLIQIGGMLDVFSLREYVLFETVRRSRKSSLTAVKVLGNIARNIAVRP